MPNLHIITLQPVTSWGQTYNQFFLNGDELNIYGIDVESVTNLQQLYHAIYDQYQTSDTIHDNDKFMYKGVEFAYCDGCHVLLTEHGKDIIGIEISIMKLEITKAETRIDSVKLSKLNSENLLRLYGELEHCSTPDGNIQHYNELIQEQTQGYREY